MIRVRPVHQCVRRALPAATPVTDPIMAWTSPTTLPYGQSQSLGSILCDVMAMSTEVRPEEGGEGGGSSRESARVDAVKVPSALKSVFNRLSARFGGADDTNEVDGVVKSSSGNSTLGRVIGLARPEARNLGIAVGSIALTTGVSLVFPMALGKILDLSLADTHYSPYMIAGGLLGLFGVQSALIVLRSAILTRSGERISSNIRTDLFSSLMKQEVGFFDQHRTGDLINRLSSDTVVVQKALTSNISQGLRAASMSLGGTAMLIYISPSLALVSLFLIPPIGLGAVFFGRYIKDQQKAVQTLLGKTIETAEELVSSVRTVRQFGQEKAESGVFADRVKQAMERAITVGNANAIFEGGVHMAANISIIAVLGYGGSLVASGGLTAGDLTAFMMYSIYVGFNFSALSSTYTDIMAAAGAASRIFEILDREPQMRIEGGSQPDTCNGEINFRNISFSYPLRPDITVLKDITLDVPRGKVIAIVGGSGSGKSTIGSLLTRLYEPTGGSIFLDGQDIVDIDPVWLRRNIATVAQEPILFARSIFDNIRYGRPDATAEEVLEAARMAHVDTFVDDFPDKYDTLVGERGIQLSGGQKQRVAIARAVLTNPAVMILDEATSALDAESEFAVQQALESVAKHRTVITIAHRLSTMQTADLIAVIQDGKIAEVGSFQELEEKQGVFHSLVQRQLLD